MGLFHKHNWVKVKETYAPPYIPTWQAASQDLFERAACGITTIIWECQECGKIYKEEMLGK